MHVKEYNMAAKKGGSKPKNPSLYARVKAEARKKTGPKAVKWSVTASGRRRKKKAAEGGRIHRGRKVEMV